MATARCTNGYRRQNNILGGVAISLGFLGNRIKLRPYRRLVAGVRLDIIFYLIPVNLFDYSFEYAKILKDGHDVENHQDCSRLRNDLVTVEFGASEFLTAEAQIQNMESRVRTQFVVVKGGLDSGW